MKIKRIIVGPIETNCYFVINANTKKCLIIDPGDDPEKIVTYLKENELNPIYIVNTHGHADHIMGNNYLKDKYKDIKLLVHKDDVDMLLNATLNLSGVFVSCNPDRILVDDDIIDMDDFHFKVIHTPGHTKGGICLLIENHLFSGDTLFQSSVGRTDLPGGSSEQILSSIKEKLFPLGDEVFVYPGHGEYTSIKDEKMKNPFF